jgi:integrase
MPEDKRLAVATEGPSAGSQARPHGRRDAARRERLTKAIVDGFGPAVTEYTVWDVDVRRLGLRVLPTGSKVYVLRLRQDGRQRWVKIGHHGDPWTPETARREAQRVLGLAAAGKDVTLPRERAREQPTMKAFAERFMGEYAAAHLKPSSQEVYQFIIDNHVVPALGKLRVDRVQRADVEALHLKLQATPTAANRTLVLLHGMFERAEAWGLRPQNSNPAQGIRYYRERKRSRFLSAAEFARLGQTFRELEGRESPFVLAAFKLLMVTGCRCSEIFRLRWDEVDLDRGVLNLKDSKTGPKTVALSEAALVILGGLPRVAGNPYVIVGWKHGQPYFGETKTWARIRTKAGLDDLRIHDLRHAFASVAISNSGASLALVGGALGHSSSASTGRYAHLAQDPVRAVSETTAGLITEWMGKPAPGPAQIAAFRRKRS